MTPDQQASADPIAVILARVEVKLDSALAEQARHSRIIDQHAADIVSLGNRVTAIEAAKPKNVAAWAGTFVALAAVAVAIIAIIVPS